MASINEQIHEFIDIVNCGIYDHKDLTRLNNGGCGWYAYYMKRAIESRWGDQATVLFQYLNTYWEEGEDYTSNIMANLKGRRRRVSCSHVVLKVVIPSEREEFYFDSEDIYYDSIELEDRGYSLERPFDIPPYIYRKGALENSKEQWNDWYNVRKGNKALRECLRAY